MVFLPCRVLSSLVSISVVLLQHSFFPLCVSVSHVFWSNFVFSLVPLLMSLNLVKPLTYAHNKEKRKNLRVNSGIINSTVGFLFSPQLAWSTSTWKCHLYTMVGPLCLQPIYLKTQCVLNSTGLCLSCKFIH